MDSFQNFIGAICRGVINNDNMINITDFNILKVNFGLYGADRPSDVNFDTFTNSSDFNLLKPVRTGKKLTFTTKTVGGIYYTFVGTFLKLEDFPTAKPEGQTVLKGTLTKMRGKKKVAAGTFNFIYSAGD